MSPKRCEQSSPQDANRYIIKPLLIRMKKSCHVVSIRYKRAKVDALRRRKDKKSSQHFTIMPAMSDTRRNPLLTTGNPKRTTFRSGNESKHRVSILRENWKASDYNGKFLKYVFIGDIMKNRRLKFVVKIGIKDGAWMNLSQRRRRTNRVKKERTESRCLVDAEPSGIICFSIHNGADVFWRRRRTALSKWVIISRISP